MATVKGNDLEKLIAEVIFQGVTANLPASYYVGLGTGAFPTKTTTLAGILEVSGGGYSRVELDRNTTDFPTLALVAGSWKVSSKSFQYGPATADTTGQATFAFLTDVASGTSGRFFGAVSVPEPFRLLVGDEFDAKYEYQDQ